MNNKRGMSAIIGTLLIILLVIVAVAIVWVVVRNMLESSAEDIDISSITVDLNIESAVVGTSSIPAEEHVNVTVKRIAGDEGLTHVRIVVSDGTSSEQFDQPATMKVLEMNSFKLVLAVINEADVTEITIAPMAGDSVGAALDTKVLQASEKVCIDSCQLLSLCGGAETICGLPEDCTTAPGCP